MPEYSPQPIRKVAVVILNWNGRDDTLDCLASLQRSRWSDLAVVVSDNGSSDGSRDAIAAAHPTVRFIPNGRNVGFAAGNNAGIEHALGLGADAVFVLNNDTVVPPETIAALVAALEADPHAGAACPAVAFADHPCRLWFAGSHYDPALARAGRISKWEGGEELLPAQPIRVDRGVGAAMLVRTEVIRDVGAFAEELFFLYEDVEWSLRMREAGWHILLVSRARILHKVAASQGGEALTPLTAYYGTRNDLEVGRRHSGLLRSAALRRELGCLGVHVVTALRRAPARTRWSCVVAALVGWRDFRRGQLGPR